jgi:hypothetical protein
MLSLLRTAESSLGNFAIDARGKRRAYSTELSVFLCTGVFKRFMCVTTSCFVARR